MTRYIIAVEENSFPMFAACGSHGWSLHDDPFQATSWEYEDDAKQAMYRAPGKIKYDGKVISL